MVQNTAVCPELHFAVHNKSANRQHLPTNCQSGSESPRFPWKVHSPCSKCGLSSNMMALVTSFCGMRRPTVNRAPQVTKKGMNAFLFSAAGGREPMMHFLMSVRFPSPRNPHISITRHPFFFRDVLTAFRCPSTGRGDDGRRASSFLGQVSRFCPEKRFTSKSTAVSAAACPRALRLREHGRYSLKQCMGPKQRSTQKTRRSVKKRFIQKRFILRFCPIAECVLRQKAERTLGHASGRHGNTPLHHAAINGRGAPWPTAAIPMENPYCSCRLTRGVAYSCIPYRESLLQL